MHSARDASALCVFCPTDLQSDLRIMMVDESAQIANLIESGSGSGGSCHCERAAER